MIKRLQRLEKHGKTGETTPWDALMPYYNSMIKYKSDIDDGGNRAAYAESVKVDRTHFRLHQVRDHAAYLIEKLLPCHRHSLEFPTKFRSLLYVLRHDILHGLSLIPDQRLAATSYCHIHKQRKAVPLDVTDHSCKIAVAAT